MKFTGERYIPTEHGQIRIEHYHRYAIVLDIVKGKVVLDVACGEGYGSFLMADSAHTVVGVDISDEAVQHAASSYGKPNLKFVQGSAADLVFPDHSFDVVVSFETIEHLAEQEEMLMEIRRVLRPSGFLIMSSPNRPVYSEENDEQNKYHVKEMDFQEFDTLLRSQFPKVEYFGQRLLISSVIQPLNKASSTSSVWSDDGSKLHANSSDLKKPVYYLAVCGSVSVDLPDLGMSALYPQSIDLLKHYVGFAKWAKSLEAIVTERDGQIASLNRAAAERDGQIASLNRAAAERDGQIASLNRAAAERDGQIASLNQAAAEREGQIASLNRAAAERDAQVARLLEQQCVERAEIIGRLQYVEGQIEALYRSSSWRLTRPLGGLSRGVTVARRGLARTARAAWHSLPLPPGLRYRTKSAVFRLGAPLLRGTSAYAAWLAQGVEPDPAKVDVAAPPAVPVVEDLRIPGGPAAPVVEDLRIPGGPAAAPRVSVVIPVHNNLDYTLACLDSIARHLPQAPIEVLVVDDASSDATAARLGERTDIRYLLNPENLGFVGSCNRGATAANGEFLFFLNNDTVVREGWLDRLLETFDDYPHAGLVGSKLIYPDGRLQEAGGIIWADGSGWNWGRLADPEAPEYNFTRDADYCSGAAIMIRRALFADLGGFDQRYAPAYYEDTDLAFAVRARGLRVLYQPRSEVVHYEGISAGTDLGSGMKAYQVRNRDRFREKWAAVLAVHGDVQSIPPRLSADRRPGALMLIIDACTPTPDQDSGSLDMLNYLRLLIEFGYRITFIPASNLLHFGHYTTRLQAMGIECLYLPHIASVAQVLETRGSDFDAVMLVRVTIAYPLIDQVRASCPGVPIIFNTVDLHFLREERLAALESGAVVEARTADTRRQELSVIMRADTTIVISPVEQALLAREIPSARVRVIPILREIPGRGCGREERAGIVFVGGFRHTPNIDAMLWFCAEIWPRVRERMPDLELSIIGSNLVPEVAALEGEGVRVLGFVEDLAPIFGQAVLSVAPLRFGAGQKGKVVQSLSYGVPSVITGVAAEGLGLGEQEGALVADTPEEFAAAVVRLYEDWTLWQRLSDSGLARVASEFSLDANRGKFAALLAELGLPSD